MWLGLTEGLIVTEHWKEWNWEKDMDRLRRSFFLHASLACLLGMSLI